MINILLLTAALAPVEVPVPEIVYTGDSVIQEGVTCEIEEVALGEEIAYYLHVNVNTPLGYDVFDDSETEYIDGIKVGESYLPSSYTLSDTDYNNLLTITVKTVYSKGVAGIIASINDGTYDYAQLLASPISIMQGVYYGISALSLILGGVGLFRAAKEKAKTAKEWEKIADERIEKAIKETKEASIKEVTHYISTDVLPLIEQCLSNDQNVIKAIALQTSKSKEAPAAILDLLMSITTDSNASKIINEAKRTISEAELAKQRSVEETKKALAEIVKTNTKKEDKDSLEGRY